MYEERIAAGVKFLDTTLGLKWVHRINLDQLDVQLPQDCVLGQLKYSMPAVKAFGLGFLLDVTDYELPGAGLDVVSTYMSRYATLTDEWRETIYDLQQARSDAHHI